MTRLPICLAVVVLLLFGAGVQAQETDAPEQSDSDISGNWITQAGNIVEITVDGTDVDLYFPAYARMMPASYNGTVLVYVTHYRNPEIEDCYIDAPEEDYEKCRDFISIDDPRHRFTLSLSDDGMVLSGVKEIRVLIVEWDVDENGNRINHRPTGTVWEYFSTYQWRSSNCNFSNLPPFDGNVLEKYELVEIMLDQFGLRAEFYLDDFIVQDRVVFNYDQAYLDADTGVFVPAEAAIVHPHLEELDGRVIWDETAQAFIIEVYPYALKSYVSLLTGLSILCHQVHAQKTLEEGLYGVTTQMELDSLHYTWSHRQALCALGDTEFEHHVDFLSRALEYRQMDED